MKANPSQKRVYTREEKKEIIKNIKDAFLGPIREQVLSVDSLNGICPILKTLICGADPDGMTLYALRNSRVNSYEDLRAYGWDSVRRRKLVTFDTYDSCSRAFESLEEVYPTLFAYLKKYLYLGDSYQVLETAIERMTQGEENAVFDDLDKLNINAISRSKIIFGTMLEIDFSINKDDYEKNALLDAIWLLFKRHLDKQITRMYGSYECDKHNYMVSILGADIVDEYLNSQVMLKIYGADKIHVRQRVEDGAYVLSRLYKFDSDTCVRTAFSLYTGRDFDDIPVELQHFAHASIYQGSMSRGDETVASEHREKLYELAKEALAKVVGSHPKQDKALILSASSIRHVIKHYTKVELDKQDLENVALFLQAEIISQNVQAYITYHKDFSEFFLNTQFAPEIKEEDKKVAKERDERKQLRATIVGIQREIKDLVMSAFDRDTDLNDLDIDDIEFTGFGFTYFKKWIDIAQYACEQKTLAFKGIRVRVKAKQKELMSLEKQV